MSWCPNCKYEYKEGIAHCSDCGADLVNILVVPDKEEDESIRLSKEFSSNNSNPIDSISNATTNNQQKSTVYIKKSDQQKEMASSAYTFLIVGIAGLIGLMLVILQVIPLTLSPDTRFLVYGVMGLIFIVFIGIGIISMKNAKVLLEEATIEDCFTTSLLDWFHSSYQSLDIDQDCGLIDASLQESSLQDRYFKRTERMKQLISAQYLDLNEPYLDQLIDDLYQKIWQD